MLEAAMIAGIVGGVTSAVGAYRQGQAAQAQAKQEALWHEYNAELSRKQALEAEQQALAEARRQKRAADEQMARMRAAYGASGVLMSEGSPLRVLEQSAADAVLDRLNLLRRGRLSSDQYMAQAALDTGQAGLSLMRGRAAKRASRWRTGSTLLSGLSSSLTNYYRG